jgi:phosphocarrier protein HPr
MIKETITVTNEEGISARVASSIVQNAGRFESQILMVSGPKHVNGKSIMGVLSLKAKKGTKLELTVAGPDEEQAADAMRRFFEGGLS